MRRMLAHVVRPRWRRRSRSRRCRRRPATETPLTLTKLRADWIGSTHQIFVDTTWTPKRFETQVTVKISVNGESLRTLQVKRWVIGHKLFKLTVPDSVAAGQQGAHRGARPAPRPATTTAPSARPAVELSAGALRHGEPARAAGASRRRPATRRVRAPRASASSRTLISPIRFASAASSPRRRSAAAIFCDAARAVHALDLEDLGDHAVSVPGAWGTPGTLEASSSTADRQQPVASGCWLAGIEPTVTVTVRLVPSPPVTASLILSPAA